ncbi:MAG TPA: aspartyl protease family protein [Candidatus Tumulicola sp.]|nr:aspartyl protease family protein [Candidatus Tumulicola sp.]
MTFTVRTAVQAAVAAALVSAPSVSLAKAPPDAVASVLAQSRAALGGAALSRVRVLETHSKLVAGGLTGTGASWQEIAGPRYAESYDLPPLAGGDGYDGTVAWNRDGSGLVWVDGGQMGRAQTIAQAFAASYALWQPGRGGATVVSEGVQNAGGRAYDVLSVLPPHSPAPFDLWFDRTTHLPSRFTQTIGPDTTVTTLSQFRAVDGLMVPYASHTESSDGNSSDATVVQAIANPADGLAHLNKPSSDVHDFSIAGGASQTSVPFDLVENHVYLSVMLDGKGPYRFIYDTGGANIVDPAVAREIGAAGHGSIQGGGVGSTTESVSFAKVDSLQIGDATVKDQLFGVAPTRLGFGMSGGQPVDGLIGFEVLSRFVTTFDYPHDRVVLAMPGASAPAGAHVESFVLDGRQPQFACAIDTIASQCTLDTGSRASISLMSPFIAAHPSVVPAVESAPGVNGFGFGGPAMGKLGRITSVSFASFTLHDVVGDFSTQTKGAFAVPFVAANVGGGIFKRFSLTLDYGRQTMALVAGPGFAQPDVYERAGLFLLNRGGKYVVIDARPGTPAAKAGILKGDTIDTIDGKPAASMSLQAVRELFFGAPGTVLQLGLIDKDGAKRTVSLTLQNIV